MAGCGPHEYGMICYHEVLFQVKKYVQTKCVILLHIFH